MGTTQIPVGSKPVVVGVDGSPSAMRAARWAAREAASRKVPLTIVHSCPLVPATVPDGPELSRKYAETVLGQGREWLDQAAASAREVAPDVVVSTELTGGDAAAVLVGRSANAELVVLGSRGLGGFTGLLVGSIAVALATHGHCPVVVVRWAEPAAEPREDAPVVVGADGSATSDDAVGFAFAAAAARGVPLVAVRTWMDMTVANAWQLGLAVDWEPIQAAELRLLDQQLAEHQSRYPDVSVRREVARDRPAHTLLDQARNAGLVVVGSRGRGGFRGLLLGSTGQALIHHAACPVAVVPPSR
jgi:nucleotide-binding universal stress UspA family protein